MTQKNKTFLKLSLIVSGLLVYLIVIIGGITRLTNSGLSMVEWKPLSDVFYPHKLQQWQELFDNYKSFPEFKKLNQGMTLDAFKVIYFWEFIHRQAARLLGVFIFFSILYICFTRQLKTWIGLRFLCLFILVCMQGALGWYMVKSGLINKPYVSHLRLAAHLCLAFFTLQFVWWTFLDLTHKKNHRKKIFESFDLVLIAFYSVLILQIIYGAFTAGLKAGYMFNTFPKMGPYWLPIDLVASNFTIYEITHNPVLVQFFHRLLAFILVALFVLLLLLSKKTQITASQKKAMKYLAQSLFLQFFLGVCTLIFLVPIYIAVTHQVTALILLSSTSYLIYTRQHHLI